MVNNKKELKRFSVRILKIIAEQNESDEENIESVGSGILLVTAQKAYIFTAAHVIEDKNTHYRIQCYFHVDDVDDAEAEEYIYEVQGSDFRIHSCFDQSTDKKKFNSYDIAGIELKKRTWMEQMPGMILLTAAQKMGLYGTAYPKVHYENDICFSTCEIESEIKEVSLKKHRFQFIFQQLVDRSDLGKALEGCSGAGLLYPKSPVNAGLVLGVFVNGQGVNVRFSEINAVSSDRIADLCRENDWPVPKSYVSIEEISVETENEPEEEHLEVVELSGESLVSKSAEIRDKFKQIRTCIWNVRISNALKLCIEMEKSADFCGTASDNEKCYLAYMKAHCFLILNKIAEGEAVLGEANKYAVPEKYWILLERGIIDLMKKQSDLAQQRFAEASSIAEIGDLRAKIMLRFVEAVKMDAGLEEKLEYLQKTVAAHTLDVKARQTLYNMKASLCIVYNDRARAAEYFKQAYSEQGDKSILLNMAMNYYAMMHRADSTVDMILCEKACMNYVSYLMACDAAVREVFYQCHGIAFIECAHILHNYSLLLEHIDKVCEFQTASDVRSMLVEMKVDAQMEIGIADYTIISSLPCQAQRRIYLHHNIRNLTSQHTELLDKLYIYQTDADAGVNIGALLEKTKEELSGLKEKFRNQTAELENYISENQNLSKDKLYYIRKDLLYCLLVIKDETKYRKYVSEFCAVYSELAEECTHYEILNDEAAGKIDEAEAKVWGYVALHHTPENMQYAISFCLRNQKFSKVLELYENIIKEKNGIGGFERAGLIFQYCDYLLKPSSTRLKALQEFLKYQEELTEPNQHSILEMRLKHCTYNYNNYNEWIKLTEYWINECHHEAEYRDAIMLAVYNLKQDEAKYYYHQYVQQYFPGKSPQEQKRLSPEWMWPFFALTEPPSDVEADHRILPENLEDMIRNRHNLNWKKTDGWKLFSGNADRTAVFDLPFLYMLSKYELLENVLSAVNKLYVAYSTVDCCLRTRKRCKDPVIDRILQWIKVHPQIVLYEAEFSAQAGFRERFGENGWSWKGVFCIAKEKNIPIVASVQDHEKLMEEMQPNIIWAGDFWEFIC